jgi:hypothetical protein
VIAIGSVAVTPSFRRFWYDAISAVKGDAVPPKGLLPTRNPGFSEIVTLPWVAGSEKSMTGNGVNVTVLTVVLGTPLGPKL